MNVIERKYYTCEKCGRMSQNEEKIKECESVTFDGQGRWHN